MKTKYLINNKYKPLGWFLLVVGLIIGGYIVFVGDLGWSMKVFPLLGDDDLLSQNPSFEWSYNDIEDEVASLLIIIGGILVAFSKTEDEDEFVSKIRLESLLWATCVNYIILLFAVVFVYGMPFFNVMIYNMFTVLVLFILKFHYEIAKSKKNLSYDE